MLATDVAARGLDFEDIDLVINFNFPKSVSKYIHRVGRTARAGKKGSCITMLNDDELQEFKKLCKKLKKKAFNRKVNFNLVKNIMKEIE